MPIAGKHSIYCLFFVATLLASFLSFGISALPNPSHHPDLEKKITELTDALHAAKPSDVSPVLLPLIDAHLELIELLLDDRDFESARQHLRTARGLAVTRLVGRPSTELAARIEVRRLLAEGREKNDGRGLRAEYYQSTDFSNELAERTVPNVDFAWAEGAPDSDVPARPFSIRFTGVIAARPGDYRLIASHSGSCHIWLDELSIIDDTRPGNIVNDAPMPLTGKPQTIRIEYTSPPAPAANAFLSLRWHAPTAKEEAIIPAEAFHLDKSAALRLAGKLVTPAKGCGLAAEYFTGDIFAARDRRLTRIDPRPSFFWDSGRPDDGIGDHFCVSWAGFLRAPAAGKYELIADVNDAIKVSLDGAKVISMDRWGASSAVVELTDRPAAVSIQYNNFGAAAYTFLRWKRANTKDPATIIPPAAFFTDKTTAEYAPAPRR